MTATGQGREKTVRAPDTGAPLHRDTRPYVVHYRGLEQAVMLDGYYPANEADGDSVHLGEDLEIIEATQMKLKRRYEAAESNETPVGVALGSRAERWTGRAFSKGHFRHPKTGGLQAKKTSKGVRPSLWKKTDTRRQG